MNQNKELTIVQNLVNELKQNNSALYKKDVLTKYMTVYYPSLTAKLFSYVFDFDKVFHVTSSNILKHYNDDLSDAGDNFGDLFELLNNLIDRSITGNVALHCCVKFIKQNETFKDLLLNIFDKDLKIGVSGDTINDIVPNTVKVFKVALAGTFSQDQISSINDSWEIQRKLDGVRCLAFYNNDKNISFIGRSGKELTGLDLLKQDIIDMHLPQNTVLDGEVCIINEDGVEDFKAISGFTKRKDFIIEKPKFVVFDILSQEEFYQGRSTLKYKDRLGYLRSFAKPEIEKVAVLDSVPFSLNDFDKLQDVVMEKGWEGLILRKDTVWENKRSKNLLKVKTFFDDEYKVVDVEMSEVQEVVNGIAKKIPAVGALVINSKKDGNKIKVGSGLSLQQRKDWFNNPDSIIGKTITVKYKKESQDADGNWSLNFPTLKNVIG